ncbi:hypothetical protein GCM10023199_60300 [Actinomycetospora chibensis]
MRAENEEPVLVVEHERNRRSGNYYPILPESVPGRRSNVLDLHMQCTSGVYGVTRMDDPGMVRLRSVLVHVAG